MSKPELRAAMRAARKAFVAALSAAERAGLEQRLGEVLAPLTHDARVIAAYQATGSEIDVTVALAGLAAEIAYPMLDHADSPLRFCVGACDTLAPWAGGLQPAPTSAAVIPDLVLVPLLAVDQFGHRLGQGGGHYDRALPALRAAGASIVGVGWDIQRLDFALQADEWDVALDAFASPGGLETFE